MPSPEEILDYWFGKATNTLQINKDKAALWWGKSEQNDAECVERFADTLERVGNGDLDDWTREPRGTLALILCLDQFSRVIYRGTGRMFENDAQAQRLSQHLCDSADEQSLPVAYRIFAYMPLMHAEDMVLQDRALGLFEALADAEEDEAGRNIVKNNLKFMHAHRDIIARFGRFPHRNALLGRESTPEEIEFLKGPNSSF